MTSPNWLSKILSRKSYKTMIYETYQHKKVAHHAGLVIDDMLLAMDNYLKCGCQVIPNIEKNQRKNYNDTSFPDQYNKCNT